MGTVRQRRKQRSSLPKVKSKAKPKLTNPKSNPIIAQNWDNRLTLAQNYRKLGLTVKLNTRAGGTEKPAEAIAGPDNVIRSYQDPLAIISSASKTKVDPTEVTVERDPTTGAIIRITDSSWENSNPLNDPLNELSDDEKRPKQRFHTRTEFVSKLEEQAKADAPRKPRQQSQKEQEWLQELVNKHGDNYARMMRDKKLNVYQLSEGDIKSRIKKWRETQTKEGVP